MRAWTKQMILLMLLLLLPWSVQAEGQRLRDKLGIQDGAGAESVVAESVHYRDMLSAWGEMASGSDAVTLLALDAAEASEENLHTQDGHTFLRWNDAQDSYTWTFTIESEGLYQIDVTYMALAENSAQIARGFLLDGELPYEEANTFQLPQTWVEKEAPFRDINGDEVAPGLVQMERIRTYGIYDTNGLYAEPLCFHLTAGEHTLTLSYISGSLLLEKMEIKGRENLPDYAAYSADPLPAYTGEPIIVQGEEAIYRSDMVQRRFYNADVNTQPFEYEHIRRNVIGAWRWQNGNSALTWEMTVPQDGAYALVMRALQNNSYGIPSARRVEIDGETPFEEALDCAFQYDTDWQGYVFADAQGEPYLFNLTAGTHTITMTVTSGQMAEVLLDLQKTNLLLAQTIRDITKVTGINPDVNFRYQLEKKIPWLKSRMAEMVADLESQLERLEGICGAAPQAANAYVSAIEELKYAHTYPERIPSVLGQIISCQAALAETYASMQYFPLTVDYLALTSPELIDVQSSSGLLDKLNVTAYNFLSSFTKNYDNLSKRSDTQKEVREVIDVWIGRSKEWGELVQTMADEEFTPETGIAVRVNIIPGGTSASGLSPLMLSIITGKAPDAVVGSDSSSPFELAIRHAAVDLTQFEDYEEVAERFFPSALTPFTFEGSVYALPETLDTVVMFYRTDIFAELGLKPPATWDELMYRTIPVLKQHAYQFYISTANAPSGFDMFLWQNGGDYYNADLTATGLDTDSAYQAFEKWTRLYTMYDTPEDANAFNHFRVGDIPLFIGTLADYMTISAAAPDLYGRWAVTNVPGTVQADGSVNGTAGGTVMATMIFSQSQKQEEAWEFLKWWTSDEVQDRFATEIEAVMGRDYRWFSANRYAFSMRSTSKEDMAVFLKALEQQRFIQPTIGGYITARHVSNAWTRVVVATTSEITPRDSLEEAVKEINHELTRKQIEYAWKPDAAANKEE